jgi:hypothetical protein
VMYSLVITGVRLENHLLSPVMCREQPESINQTPSMPPTCKIKNESKSEQTTQHWVSTKRIKPVSCHLLKCGVSKIHPTSPRWNTHMSPWRTTHTTKGRPWPVAPLGPEAVIVPPYSFWPRAKERPVNSPRPNPTHLPPSLCGGSPRGTEGPIRRTREGGSEWEPIKILLEGDGNSNKINAASNTLLHLTTQVGQAHVATGVPLDLGTNTQPSDPRT